MAKVMEDNFYYQVVQLKSQIEVLAKDLGELLIPELSKLVGKIQDAVTAISNMDEEDKKAIIDLTEFAAAVGPVLVVLGGIITAVGMF